MKKKGLLEILPDFLEDKRSDNKHFPFDILLTLSITAKLKLKTSLTDVPYAVEDAELLSEIGFNVWDTDRDLSRGLFSEGVMRKLTGQYTSSEKSTVVKIDGETFRGYKLGVLRGLSDDSGVAQEIVFGDIKTHDMELCRDMLLSSPCLKKNDILINDRGFLSRDILNQLKSEKGVDVYVPAKKNMAIYQDAVKLAATAGKWQKHPNKKRKNQEIQLVSGLGNLWESSKTGIGVELNACVVHDKKDEEYYVFLTTDLSKSARQAIQTYEIRPEIEEDFRQMKDFWKLTDFKSTKYTYITFHIVMTLMGYLFFQIYKNIEEGKEFIGKSLPVVVKNYKMKKESSVIIYAGCYFGIFPFLEFIQLYADCSLEVRKLLDPILGKV